MRIVMMGTGPFAVPTFKALLASQHQVVALVTKPPRPLHRKSAAEANPMREVAEEQQLPVLAPERINDAAAQVELQAFQADLFVVCDYGQILSPQTLQLARLGGINLHGSLLPAYRGAAPINWALYQGDTITGVTVIHMTPKIDAGPTIGRAELPIGPDDTAVDLEPRLAELGAPLVLECIERLAAGTAVPMEQIAAQVTQARRLRKSDGAIDWSRSAVAIKNQIRAFQPWPKTFTNWERPGHPPLRLIVEQAAPLAEPAPASPGTVVAVEGKLVVATGDGQLAIQQIQPAGKRVMSASEFLRGYPVQVGDRFVNSESE